MLTARNAQPLRTSARIALAFLITVLALSFSYAVEITFDRTFIEKNKNRATIRVPDLEVIDTHEKAKRIDSTGENSGLDGDIHCSAWSDTVGFAIVAEISNARLAQNGVDALVDAENGPPISATGVWRVWPEHARQEPFIQGSPERPTLADKTNPDHIFELHPLTEIGNIDLGQTFTRIKDQRTGTEFAYKDAEQAFDAINDHEFSIRSERNTVTVQTKAIGYNYIRFRVRLHEKPSHRLDDGGLSFFGSIFKTGRRSVDDYEVPLVGKTRFILVPGTEPMRILEAMEAGTVADVIAIPRLNFALLSWRVKHERDDPEVLRRTIPYELVILAVLNAR